MSYYLIPLLDTSADDKHPVIVLEARSILQARIYANRHLGWLGREDLQSNSLEGIRALPDVKGVIYSSVERRD